MAYKWISSLRGKETVQSSIMPGNSEVQQVPKKFPTLIAKAVQDQVQQKSQKSSTLKEQSMQESGQQVPRNSSSLKSQVVQERVKQVPIKSSTIVSNTAEKQLQQVTRHSSTLKAPNAQDKVQQNTQNSGENEQFGEQGCLTKNKRGNTIMAAVHGRQERKLIVLNRYNQPIGLTLAVVTGLSSFLGTLARNAMFCPLNIHN